MCFAANSNFAAAFSEARGHEVDGESSYPFSDIWSRLTKAYNLDDIHTIHVTIQHLIFAPIQENLS